MSGKCLEGVRMQSGIFLDGVWTVSGMCLKGEWIECAPISSHALGMGYG